MKFFSDQRRLYGLAGTLLVLTAALCLTWGLWRKPTATPAQVEPTARSEPTATAAIEIVTPEPTGAPASASAGGVKTVAYYQDNYGHLVPVMRTISEAQGVAKATLSLMVSSPANDMEAARLGLRTVLPEGTTIDLDIANGVARVDLGSQADRLSDAQAEANMVDAVVQTLTEFPTVHTVRFLLDGKAASSLKHGTSVAGDFSRRSLNLQSAADGLTPEECDTVMLYFPGETGSLLVPVTRMVYGDADLPTAVLELAKGPGANSALSEALPSGCGLIGVTEKDGEVTVNFTRDFIDIVENSDGGRQALRALALTCAQFDGVEKVAILVEGEPYDPGKDALAVPTFVNVASDVADQFLQAQSSAILETD